jgi:hypothetical protein
MSKVLYALRYFGPGPLDKDVLRETGIGRL